MHIAFCITLDENFKITRAKHTSITSVAKRVLSISGVLKFFYLQKFQMIKNPFVFVDVLVLLDGFVVVYCKFGTEY